MSTQSPIGRPAPWFFAASASNPRFAVHTLGGRYVLLLFLGPGGAAPALAALAVLAAHRQIIDDQFATALIIWTDDAPPPRDQIPGVRVLRDADRAVSVLYGAAVEGDAGYSPRVILLDPQLRLLDAEPLARAQDVIERLVTRPAPDLHSGIEAPAPVLVAPRVFEPEFCRALIAYYDAAEPTPSGFMREVNGVTKLISDPSHKIRADVEIADQRLRTSARERLRERLVPMIQRAFQFTTTRMERDIVACYDARSGGHFRPHRDNTTKGTAHRRFAVTLALNDDFAGGGLRFPEYGPRVYRPPTGAAVVFSCSILHEALPVSGGKRYCYLPFLYDEAGAKIREANAAFVDGELSQYRAAAAAKGPAQESAG
jgi:hypothetical protein